MHWKWKWLPFDILLKLFMLFNLFPSRPIYIPVFGNHLFIKLIDSYNINAFKEGVICALFVQYGGVLLLVLTKYTWCAVLHGWGTCGACCAGSWILINIQRHTLLRSLFTLCNYRYLEIKLYSTFCAERIYMYLYH